MSIQFIRYQKEQILVRFGGIQRNIEDNEEKIDEIMGACLMYKEDPSEDNEQYLKGLLNPITKEEFTDDFDIDDNGTLYLKGTKEQLPEALSEMVKTYIDKKFPIKSLVNFWKLCLANPNKTARDGFYEYVKNFGVVITDHGYAILYKAVNTKSDSSSKDVSSSLSRWISAEYLKIKEMKKSPKNYPVFSVFNMKSKEYETILSTHSGSFPSLDKEVYDYDSVDALGTLQELYDEVVEGSKELSESSDDITLYRPWHSGDHGMEIRLGEPVTMPREKCDPDITVSCSYGLHVGSHSYVSSFGRGMDAVLAILVNPKDVVALPEYDHSKIRVCEYFPYAEIERDDKGNWKELSQGYFEEDFLEYEEEELEQALEDLHTSVEEGEDVDESQQEAINQRLVYLRDI